MLADFSLVFTGLLLVPVEVLGKTAFEQTWEPWTSSRRAGAHGSGKGAERA
ncbi:hypothetical protein GCM10010413_07120 [Promicromonospora sukumoe]